MSQRRTTITRKTSETDIELKLLLDGSGTAWVETGIGFLDHMLTALSKHAGFDLTLVCQGDIHVDDHHTAEDCAIVLGQAIHQCLGERRGITRFGHAYAPLDEALARTVIDLSGRPAPHIDLGLTREKIGELSCENIHHFFHTVALEMRAAVHVDVLKGTNDHHRAEAAFKSFALAIKQAITKTNKLDIPSTKGVL